MKTDLIEIAVQTSERSEIIAAKLRSEGIECMLNKVEVQLDPSFAGVKVLVNQGDLERAMEILSALHFQFGDDNPVVEEHRDEIVTIAISTWQKAQLMHELLESAGIQSALLNVNLLQSGISAGVKLRVFSADVERAMEIIRSMEDVSPVSSSPAYAMGEILVPVDFTKASENASRLAAELAVKAGVPVRLLHAYFNPVITAMPFEEATYSIQSSVTDLFRDTEEGLRKSIQLLNRQLEETMRNAVKSVKVHNTIVRGIASDAILDYSSFNKPGMIVMSKGLHEDRTGLFMGSVSGKVAERAEVPVLVVPNNYVYSGLDQFRVVAYATDFDESDMKALRRLFAITRYFDPEFHCLHVSVPGESLLDKARIQLVRRELEQMSGKDVHCSVIESPDLLAGFNNLIREGRIGMLAMTTRKRNILTRLLFPSLTHRIMLHTDVPLMVFHA